MIPSRTDINDLIHEYFPNGASSRKETNFGFSDTIKIGFLNLVINVYEGKSRYRQAGSIDLSIRGTRLMDGSSGVLWTKVFNSVSDVGLNDAFLEVQKTLLGIAAAILMITGDPPSVTKASEKDNFIDDLLSGTPP